MGARIFYNDEQINYMETTVSMTMVHIWQKNFMCLIEAGNHIFRIDLYDDMEKMEEST